MKYAENKKNLSSSEFGAKSSFDSEYVLKMEYQNTACSFSLIENYSINLNNFATGNSACLNSACAFVFAHKRSRVCAYSFFSLVFDKIHKH